MKLQVTTNIQDVVRELDAAKVEMRPALVRALNRTADRIKVRAAREVRAAGYKLKAADVKNAIRISRASSGRLRADTIASGRPIDLVKYGARQVGDGVSVDVMQGRKVVAHAFIANLPNGGRQVLVRDPGAKHKKVAGRWVALPIRKLWGPGIPDAVANVAVQRAIEDLIDDTFPRTLAHESAWLKRRLDRLPSNPSDS